MSLSSHGTTCFISLALVQDANITIGTTQPFSSHRSKTLDALGGGFCPDFVQSDSKITFEDVCCSF